MLTKRFNKFLVAFLFVAVLVCSSLNSSSSTAKTFSTYSNNLVAQASQGEFTLPPLPYAYDALSEYIDVQTMTLHHDKHHAGYVKNLNEAIADYPELQGMTIEELLSNLDEIPQDIQTKVRNNGGGHANHTMFWSIMTPDSSGEPTGAIAEAIDETFGDFATFQQEFNDAGKNEFGSGWAWLVLDSNGDLAVTNTADQDSPISDGSYPIMGNDVWEHAYYLKYQNKRADYLDAWWNVVNWDEVNQRFERAKESISA